MNYHCKQNDMPLNINEQSHILNILQVNYIIMLLDQSLYIIILLDQSLYFIILSDQSLYIIILLDQSLYIIILLDQSLLTHGTKTAQKGRTDACQ